MFVLFFAVSVGIWSPSTLGTHSSWMSPLSYVGLQSSAVNPAVSVPPSDYNTPNGRIGFMLLLLSTSSWFVDGKF